MATRVVRNAVFLNKFFRDNRIHSLFFNEFVGLVTRENCCRNGQWQQSRSMTAHRRVQDRSKDKRVHDLEIATEKWKILSKVMFLMEILKKEPEQVIPVRSLEQYRRQINLPKPHKFSEFIQKSPKLFELYKDHRGTLWCGLTEEAENLLQEEEKILEAHSDKAAEYVTRFLMMSLDKRLPLEKIAHFRRDLGLPLDFRACWVHNYPQQFRVIKSDEDLEYLELVNWNSDWAITELEKKAFGEAGPVSHSPGILSLPFPLKFPQNYKKVYRYGGTIDHFQKRSYLSPYADAHGLKAGSLEFDKRAVAIMHELLSFTVEKRLVTDHLTHFRREFVMPQKLMRLLLKHFGIFYVSERGKRFSVFLTEAYEGSQLLEKSSLILWREKLLSFVGYRGRKKRIETFEDLSEMEDGHFIEGGLQADDSLKEFEQEEIMDDLMEVNLEDEAEMEVKEVCGVYKDKDILRVHGTAC